MHDTEPLYFKNFRDHFERRIDLLEVKIEKKIDDKIDDLAITIGNQFAIVYKKLDEIDEKFDRIDERFDRVEGRLDNIEESIEKIEGHIGRYEIRAQNIEQVLLQEHKPRIIELEKKVFA